MADFISKNQNTLIAGAIFLIGILIVYATIPRMIDEEGDRKLVDVETGFKVAKQKENPMFLIAMFIVALIAILFMIFRQEDIKEFSRERPLEHVWKDIPQSTLIKLGLPDVYNISFASEVAYVPTNDPNIKLLRCPSNKNEFGHIYITLDVGEDFKKRRTASPLVSILSIPTSHATANQLMIKNRSNAATLYRQVESLGIPKEDFKRKLAQAKMEEEDKKNQYIQNEGDNYER